MIRLYIFSATTAVPVNPAGAAESFRRVIHMTKGAVTFIFLDTQ